MTHQFTKKLKRYLDSNFNFLRIARRTILRLSIKHVHGPKKIDYQINELVVVCLVRDGQIYIKSFLEHYFSLGVKHVIFLDNVSSDDTVSIAKKYENVTIIQTRLPYKRYKYLMKEYMIKRFSRKRWALCVDIDEFFDYPYSEKITVQMLLEYLNKRSYTSVVAYMLDMFSEKDFQDQFDLENNSIAEYYKFYDISQIQKEDYSKFCVLNKPSNSMIKFYIGGIRKKVFEADVYLTKHPLVFFDGRILLMRRSAHKVEKAYIADFTCVLFHYKFVNNFYDLTCRAVKEENYGNNSDMYKKYYNVMKQNLNLKLKQHTASEIFSTNDLIENGFLIVSHDYESLTLSDKA